MDTRYRSGELRTSRRVLSTANRRLRITLHAWVPHEEPERSSEACGYLPADGGWPEAGQSPNAPGFAFRCGRTCSIPRLRLWSCCWLPLTRDRRGGSSHRDLTHGFGEALGVLSRRHRSRNGVSLILVGPRRDTLQIKGRQPLPAPGCPRPLAPACPAIVSRRQSGTPRSPGHPGRQGRRTGRAH